MYSNQRKCLSFNENHNELYLQLYYKKKKLNSYHIPFLRKFIHELLTFCKTNKNEMKDVSWLKQITKCKKTSRLWNGQAYGHIIRLSSKGINKYQYEYMRFEASLGPEDEEHTQKTI